MPKRKESKQGAREKGRRSKPKKRERESSSSEEEVHYTPTKSGSVKAIQMGLQSSHRGTSLGQWTPEQMRQAWMLVDEHNYSVSAAARRANIPVSTFKDRARKLKQAKAEGKDLTPFFGHMSGGKSLPRLFSLAEEDELTAHLMIMADSGFGITPQEFRGTVHQWAKLLGKSVSQERDEVSYNFQNWFAERHPELKIMGPSEISKYRATAPSREAVESFFELVENLYNKYKFQPNQIFNIDETGMTDQPKGQKIFCRRKGIPLCIVPGERGQLTTVMAFASVAGTQSAPMLIMKGKQVLEHWKTYMPPSWYLFASDSGYVNKDIFLSAGRIFIRFLEKQKLLGQHVVLFLDGHPSHSFNYKFAMMMAAHKIHVVTFPPHCTHFMQPYDACILAKLKSTWQSSLRAWNREHVTKKLNKEQFFIPFHRAWRTTMTPQLLQAGFRQVGLWPLDPERISDNWFTVSESLGKMTQITTDYVACDC